MDFETPIVTVDVVLLTVRDGRLCVGLVERTGEPFAGRPALVGGYVHTDKDAGADATAARVLRDKAGLQGFHLEQLATFSGPARDPRGWSVSIAYLALVPWETLEAALAGQGRLMLAPVDEVRGLPFDHDAILAAALARLSGKGAYSTLPARLLPERFTLTELQTVYQLALGVTRIDKSSFRRKVAELALIEPVDGVRADTGGRQAQLYRLREAVRTFDRRL